MIRSRFSNTFFTINEHTYLKKLESPRTLNSNKFLVQRVRVQILLGPTVYSNDEIRLKKNKISINGLIAILKRFEAFPLNTILSTPRYCNDEIKENNRAILSYI